MEIIGFQLDDIFDMAIRMEANGAEFYDLAAKSTPHKTTRLILNGLAATEQSHKSALVRMKEKCCNNAATQSDIDNEISNLLASWLNGEIFEKNKDKNLAVAMSGDMADILQVAIEMENDTVKFYTKLKEYILDDEVENILDKIIKEEQKHSLDLSEARYELL